MNRHVSQRPGFSLERIRPATRWCFRLVCCGIIVLSNQRFLLRLLLELLELGSLLLEQAYDPLDLGGIVHLVRIFGIPFH